MCRVITKNEKTGVTILNNDDTRYLVCLKDSSTKEKHRKLAGKFDVLRSVESEDREGQQLVSSEGTEHLDVLETKTVVVVCTCFEQRLG